jgi:enamine deaminase RidA (YjgF/YER057c/UK114 family)
VRVTERLKQLDLSLAAVAGPFGAYVPAKRVGNLVFVAGQLPVRGGKLIATGQVPSRCSVDLAREAARQCVINALAAVQVLPGGVDQLAGVARVGAFISSDADFTEQPKVADAASELLTQLFGKAGEHPRTAVGVNALPRDASVEIEVVFEAK